ncbi:MAG TPA: ACT domain-containing protein [Dermatophilaceae bacterium]
MSGLEDLAQLLEAMEPELQPGRYVFTTTTRVPDTANPVVLVREAEGVTLVLDQDQADRFGLAYEFIAAMITLRVHSSLDAVGLTAAVAEQLATGGISCNVVAGYFHDHLFVPIHKAGQAVDLLRDLAKSQT